MQNIGRVQMRLCFISWDWTWFSESVKNRQWPYLGFANAKFGRSEKLRQLRRSWWSIRSLRDFGLSTGDCKWLEPWDCNVNAWTINGCIFCQWLDISRMRASMAITDGWILSVTEYLEEAEVNARMQIPIAGYFQCAYHLWLNILGVLPSKHSPHAMLLQSV